MPKEKETVFGLSTEWSKLKYYLSKNLLSKFVLVPITIEDFVLVLVSAWAFFAGATIGHYAFPKLGNQNLMMIPLLYV